MMTDTQMAQVQRWLDEAALREVVEAIDNAVDEKAWARCRSYFLDEIEVDFTSLAGGTPGSMAADDLVYGGWARNLFAEKSSFHLRGNYTFEIEGEWATVYSKGYAWNLLPSRLGEDLWEVWGHYIHRLTRTEAGWKCAGMKFVATYGRGNEKVREYVP